MRIDEIKETKDYKEAIEKIKGYKTGFEFTLNYGNIPKAKGNALQIIMRDCIKAGIIESISFGLDIEGNFVEETYRKL